MLNLSSFLHMEIKLQVKALALLMKGLKPKSFVQFHFSQAFPILAGKQGKFLCILSKPFQNRTILFPGMQIVSAW